MQQVPSYPSYILRNRATSKFLLSYCSPMGVKPNLTLETNHEYDITLIREGVQRDSSEPAGAMSYDLPPWHKAVPSAQRCGRKG